MVFDEQEDTELLIPAKPKNKTTKIRKSNRHSCFRGVSRNGKKWQVQAILTNFITHNRNDNGNRKKYYGGFATEQEAAIYYDKISILTNGLAAKTNFNYRKRDLKRIIGELEMMDHLG